MDQAHHAMSDLFAQLGLEHDDASIKRFIAKHRPLAATTTLVDAPFWTPVQAAFLKEKLAEDSDWALPIDHLSASLREHPGGDDEVTVVDDGMQGEGNYAAAQRYDKSTQAFVASGQVEQAARAAEPRNAAEAKALRAAEAKGLEKARH
jgi:hypothetical protein